jgi:flagellar assembly protein FliH
MSRRARVLAPATPAEAFAWGESGVVTAAAARVEARPASLLAPATPPAPAPPGAPGPPGAVAPAVEEAPPSSPALDEQAMLAEHQARLAALEREAFTKGYAQGERAGLEAGGKRAEAMLRRVAQTIEELGGLRQTLIQETERQMVQLALTLARRVVHREVTLDPELAAALAHVALERLGTTVPATIRLNPEDYTIVAQDGARWGGATVTVVPDPSIARGGCLVESEFGSVDATIERQFDELSRALFGDH